MSQWTHITACLSVDTSIEDKNVTRIVKKYLKNAPKVTGSEADAEVFVNKKEGHNTWTNCDCEHCEFKDTILSLNTGEYECDAPDGYECPEGRYQTCVVISMQGDLRDRTKSQTKKEFNEFKKYIEKEYDIRDYSLNIEGW